MIEREEIKALAGLVQQASDVIRLMNDETYDEIMQEIAGMNQEYADFLKSKSSPK